MYARYGDARTGDIANPILASATANVPLPPLGTLFLDPATMVPLPPITLSQPLGLNALSIGIPNLPPLAGLKVYTQSIIVQPTRARFTNMTLDIIQ